MTEQNNEIKRIDPLSAAPVFIDMFFNDLKLATGTAFFIKRNEDIYLVTNWHNLSGRNSLTHEPLNKNHSIPNSIRVYHHNIDDLSDTVEIQYNIRDENDRPLWFEHPIHKSRVDVGAIRIGDINQSLVYTIEDAIAEIDPYEKWPTEVGESVFVLGYPFGLTGSFSLPIWKAASIATEPAIDINDLPCFYVDTATRQGMSGSPVVQKIRRSVAIHSQEKGLSQYRSSFLGIYSGRIAVKDGLDAQIGIVWKIICIEEIINAKKLCQQN